MHAKMPQDSKVGERGEYLCQRCETKFWFRGEELICPNCRNQDRTELVPFYVESDPQEEQMYNDKEFGQGD
jgi:hypothetical protein